jgi:hypothetical protein
MKEREVKSELLLYNFYNSGKGTIEQWRQNIMQQSELWDNQKFVSTRKKLLKEARQLI